MLVRAEDAPAERDEKAADMARQLGALPPQGSVAERGMTAALNAKVAAGELVQRLRDR